MKTSIRLILILITLPFVYLTTVIIIATITRYNPSQTEQISKFEEGSAIEDSIFSVMIWNIGYSGLGAEMDFFYDGGSKVRDTKENVYRNLYMITKFLQANDTLDFFLLQEVDKQSKRNYKINLEEHINVAMPDHFPFYATNYKVVFVPMPLLKPMGKVHSGLLSLSQHIPATTIRHTYPFDFSWPKNLFLLERCFLVNRFKTKNGKELLIINTHNSAYDDGNQRKQQMNLLKNFLQEEEAKGNTFVVGGDWNQCPPNFKPETEKYIFDTINLSYIDPNFLQKDWRFIYDKKIPTNRQIDKPFAISETQVNLIDFFLVSPNIEVISCKTVDMNFAYSDHQPVILSFKMN